MNPYLPFAIFSIILLVGVISLWHETRYAIKTNFALSNKTLVLTDSAVFFEAWSGFLQNYFPYFRNLDKTHQLIFCNKIRSMLKAIDIIGKEGQEVNEEMRILLGATFAQLTFGLKNDFLYNFSVINVYPNAFYAKQYDAYIDSATFKEKAINLSWKHFETGILDESDGINIGLRELSYALERTVRNGDKFDLHFGSYIDKWLDIVKSHSNFKEFIDFLEISGKHEHEIFSNSVCLFFEKPFDFKQQFTDLYAHLCVLLNQNPLSIADNYVYNKEKFSTSIISPELPQKVNITYKNHNWHWIYNLLVFCPIMTPLFAYIFILPNNVISVSGIFIMLVVISIALTLLLYNFNKNTSLFTNTIRLFGYNVIGLSPLVICILFIINTIIPIEEPQITSHNVSYYNIIRVNGGRHSNSYATDIELSFTDNYLEDCALARRIDIFEIDHDKLDNASVHYYTRRGLFGIEYITKKEFLYSNNEHAY